MSNKKLNELPATSKDILKKLRQLDINQWEKESLNKDWNQDKANKIKEKNAVRSLHKAINRN